MRFSLSTNWNTRRHTDGEAMVDEILGLGFDALELGYHTTEEIAAGVSRAIKADRVKVASVHAYCPVPIGAPHGYPELYLLASLDDDERAIAAVMLRKCVEFAASMGARALVVHAGRVFLQSWWPRQMHTGALLAEAETNGIESVSYTRLLNRARKRRARLARKYFESFCISLDTLLPFCERHGVALCLENLPSIEAFPDEGEMVMLRKRFDTSSLSAWYDVGHGQARANMGWITQVEAARALLPYTAGVHLHDVLPLMRDHLPPGEGGIDFSALGFYAADHIIRVFEPASDVPASALVKSLRHLRGVWSGEAAGGYYAQGTGRNGSVKGCCGAASKR